MPLTQSNMMVSLAQTAFLNCAWVKEEFCAWPVKIRRDVSCVTVSRIWLAKNTSASSMIANRTPKNIGATSANSTAAAPLRLRRNRRRMLVLGGVEGGINETSEREGDCRKKLLETD